MAKIFYVVEKAGDYAQVNFFKTEKDALSYGQSQFDEFDMFDDTDAIYDEDNDLWFTGDSLDFKKGILFQMEEGDWSIDAMDEADAREEVDGKENFGAIYFDGFKPGAYGYLGNGADGKGYKWSADDDGIEESKINNKIMKHIKLFEQFINEASSQQRYANKEVKELQNILKTRQSELANAKPEDEAYAEDRVDTIERLLVHALSYQVIANLADKADDEWNDQEVIKQMIKRQEDWLEDRQEVADLIKAKIKSNQFDETRMFSTKLFGSKNELNTKLDVTEENITNTKERIEKLKARLA